MNRFICHDYWLGILTPFLIAGDIFSLAKVSPASAPWIAQLKQQRTLSKRLLATFERRHHWDADFWTAFSKTRSIVSGSSLLHILEDVDVNKWVYDDIDIFTLESELVFTSAPTRKRGRPAKAVNVGGMNGNGEANSENKDQGQLKQENKSNPRNVR